MATVSVNGGIFFLGGLDSDRHPIDSVLLWDRRMKEFRAIPESHAEYPRYAAAAVPMGNNIFFIGGRRDRSASLSSVLVWDSIAWRVSRSIAPMPKPRSSLAAARVENLLYVFGGLNEPAK